MNNQPLDVGNTAKSGSSFSGSFSTLLDYFSYTINKNQGQLRTATEAWEKKPTDPKLTLDMQASQGDLGTVTRGVGSLISALVSLQSEITQKIK